jgi:hypothetical protein
MILLLLTAQSAPQISQVHVDGRFRDGPVTGYMAGYCDKASITPSQFLRKYRSYRDKSPQDITGAYAYLPCGVKGTISTDGRDFYWKDFVGNVIETNYPDGREHFRAGKADPQG